jgi:ribosomal protein L37AE/L43A
VSFVPLARTLTATVRQLEDVLMDGVRPERSRVPCLECGTRLMKVWTDKAADDHWTCPRCGESYDHGRYERAKHDQLSSTGAERYVYLTDAASALGRHVETVRSWVRKGLVHRTRDTAGRTVIWWPDVREQHLVAMTRAKRRTRAEAD